MSEQIHPAVLFADEKVDARPLAERLGSADELTTLSPAACSHQLTTIRSLPALRSFLQSYTAQVLAPHEFRHIYQAYQCASHSFPKELLALDQQIAGEQVLQDFQLASRHVGKRQLNRMQALKDVRVLQRYREAVNDGSAFGWHTLVYGVVLSTYSLPLRQGLLHYGTQTLNGFLRSAARRLNFSGEDGLLLQRELNAELLPSIDLIVGVNGHTLRALA